MCEQIKLPEHYISLERQIYNTMIISKLYMYTYTHKTHALGFKISLQREIDTFEKFSTLNIFVLQIRY